MNKQMVSVLAQGTFVRFDQQMLEDTKYRGEKHVSIFITSDEIFISLIQFIK